MRTIDFALLRTSIVRVWDGEIVPTLSDYIRIPNKSPDFDPAWDSHGYMEQAVSLFADWARSKTAPWSGATVEVVRLPGRTPLLLIDIPGLGDDSVLLYGHLDKQPEMSGWSEGLDPWIPVVRDGRLYGRGGADDGYAMFGALAALGALREQGVAHGRAVILIECCEESGSYDLPFYVDHLAERIGDPSLVICLDSGCGNYEQLWLTTSLRGMLAATLTVRVLDEGVHSGDASGIVPSSFRVVRTLLSRLEDDATGRILLPELHAPIPSERVEEAETVVAALGADIASKFPFAGTTGPINSDLRELVLNRTWRPQLEIIGADGLPPVNAAGNVLRPETSVKLSLRLPPSLPPKRAKEALTKALLTDPPYGAYVRLQVDGSAEGWNAPAFGPWLTAALDRASEAAFGAAPAMTGEGGSIPFMGMLGERFPDAQFVITGVLGPHSNAHGPNEFLDIETGKRVTVAIASLLADHASRPSA